MSASARHRYRPPLRSRRRQEQFGYDGDGNLTNDGRWDYTWDAENRLVTMTNNNATVGPQVGPQVRIRLAWPAHPQAGMVASQRPDQRREVPV